MDITFDHGNNSWKFHDDTMMGTWWKKCDRQTDGQTDRQTDGRTENTICRAAWSQLKMSSYDQPTAQHTVPESDRSRQHRSIMTSALASLTYQSYQTYLCTITTIRSRCPRLYGGSWADECSTWSAVWAFFWNRCDKTIWRSSFLEIDQTGLSPSRYVIIVIHTKSIQTP